MMLLLLLLLVGLVSSQQQLFSFSPDQTRALFDLCLANAECRTQYGQTDSEDYRLFDHLLRRERPRATKLEAVVPAEMKEWRPDGWERAAAVLTLINLRHDSGDACTINQVPVLDPDSGTTDCVCLEDRSCFASGGARDTTVLALLIMIAILQVLSLAGEIYRLYAPPPPPAAKTRKAK